ncbi:MAG TPA: type II toxin-antitoxin system HigB family toxin [Chitinophagaceae bacterium]
MRVHLVRKDTVEDFAVKHAASRPALEDWLTKIRNANWEAPEDINDTFSAADLLGNGSKRVVFDIGGNNYRMICKYWYGDTRVHLYIKWIGTHAAYDMLCRKGKQYTVDDF